MNALITITEPTLPVVFTEELELAHDFARASKAPATKAAYESDFRIFDGWCRARGLNALPATPATVTAFLAAQAGLGKRASTLGRRLAAIGYFHKLAGEPNPIGNETIKATLSGIRRTIGAAPVRKKAATSDIVIAMVSRADTPRQVRDRAIVLLGFAGAFRRSELVALNVDDLEETPEGLLVTIRRSKTDQEGLGRKVAIPRGELACPVEAVKAWRVAAAITEGALFRRVWNKRHQRVTDRRLAARNVAAIVKAGASRLGLDAAAFGGHSLRAGFVTSAAKRGANLFKICDTTGHKSLEMLRITPAMPSSSRTMPARACSEKHAYRRLHEIRHGAGMSGPTGC
jgi:site-specific recombinase XerD